MAFGTFAAKLMRLGPISTPKAILAIFLFGALPLWLIQAWVLGLLNISKEYPITDLKPLFEQSTELEPHEVSFCLRKNRTGKLALQKVRSPSTDGLTIRLRNRPQHIVVDVLQVVSTTNVKAYKEKGGKLSPVQTKALEDCVYR